MPPLPGVADFKSEWPGSNRNQWPTSFRNRWPTSSGIRNYAAVRELVADLFAEHVGASVKKTIRETVEAVRALEQDEVSVSEIAKKLELDRSAVSRRVADAIAGGYLKNHEIN